jgi:HEAT repeat protein
VAAEALGGLGTKAACTEVLGRLLKLLRDPVKHVRHAAANSLGQMGVVAARPKILARLVALMQDPDQDTRTVATTALDSLANTGVRVFHAKRKRLAIRTVTELAGS